MRGELYRDAANEYRWRIRARNGRIVADSGEGYKRKRAAEDAFWRVVLWAGGTDVPLCLVGVSDAQAR